MNEIKDIVFGLSRVRAIELTDLQRRWVVDRGVTDCGLCGHCRFIYAAVEAEENARVSRLFACRGCVDDLRILKGVRVEGARPGLPERNREGVTA